MRARTLFFATVVMLLIYVQRLRPRMARWGATADDIASVQPGDEVVSDPAYFTTHAVTIDAPPADVWPWLAQMGYQRGGLYSYDWLDQLFGYLDGPSAEEVLPEFQNIAAGDVIPLGNGPDWPVHTAIPNRALVLAPDAPGFAITWAFILHEVRPGRTRLISRVRASASGGSRAMLFMSLVIEPAAFIMERGMLLGIKRRAETLSAQRHLPPAIRQAV